MPITITDPVLLARWTEMQGVIELEDSDRNAVGRIQTTWPEPFPREGRYFFIDRVSDPVLLAEFARVGEPVEVRGPNGQLVGRFERHWPGKPPPGVRSPISDEEFEDARKSPDSGRTLAEFWASIREKYGA